ncbi:hypothetical protein caldi_17930 [Caldinitratiruptor microaerophilus]|uniref:Uncharacterized protein n=1 Tax=Caldinitratiruptor microaerophilus TaxID=671077 RepID=A0AA35CLP6_9FIRM|nr:hypothetical protein caldi_17930 [Caldinitratiruptor microaerophilus]
MIAATAASAAGTSAAGTARHTERRNPRDGMALDLRMRCGEDRPPRTRVALSEAPAAQNPVTATTEERQGASGCWIEKKRVL